jgi:Bacterial protein of unknown function (DUF922)
VRSDGGVRQRVDSEIEVGARLFGLQRNAGNLAVTRLLTSAALQRQHSSAGSAAPAKRGKTVGKVGGKRPTVKQLTKDFEDCNAAVEWLTSGAWTGDAQPIYKPTPGKIRTKKLPDGTVKAEVELTWSYDDSSTVEMIVPTWPNMTTAERAAVNQYEAALKAHEVKHFDVAEKVVKALPKYPSPIPCDEQEAIANLQTEVDTYGSDAKRALDEATEEYDTKTQNGKTQSAVGGQDVRLDCPPKP